MALTHSLIIPSSKVPETPEEVIAPLEEFPNAYARILVVRTTPQLTMPMVVWHEDQAARQRDDQPVLMKEFAVPTSEVSGDVYPAAYAYLKTLPEFEGALDVFEPVPETTVVTEDPVPETNVPPAEA